MDNITDADRFGSNDRVKKGREVEGEEWEHVWVFCSQGVCRYSSLTMV